MAYELTARAWNAPIEGVCKLVFLSLCNRAKIHPHNPYYECWPSAETLARDCGISDRCVRTHIRWLIEEGYVLRFSRGMQSSIYRIVLDKLNLPDDFDLEQGYKGEKTPFNRRKNFPHLLAKIANKGWKNLPTEPVIEPINEPITTTSPAPAPCPSPRAVASMAATPAAQPVVVANEIPENLLADWILVRKSKGRKVLTHSELSDIRAEAAQAGMSLTDAVRECVNSGWARFKAAWLPAKPVATAPSATPVDAAILEKMAAQATPVPVQDVPPLSPQEREAFRAAVERIKSTVVTKPKLAWAQETIAKRRAGEHISYGTLKMAMDALGLTTWKEPACAAA